MQSSKQLAGALPGTWRLAETGRQQASQVPAHAEAAAYPPSTFNRPAALQPADPEEQPSPQEDAALAQRALESGCNPRLLLDSMLERAPVTFELQIAQLSKPQKGPTPGLFPPHSEIWRCFRSRIASALVVAWNFIVPLPSLLLRMRAFPLNAFPVHMQISKLSNAPLGWQGRFRELRVLLSNDMTSSVAGSKMG